MASIQPGDRGPASVSQIGFKSPVPLLQAVCTLTLAWQAFEEAPVAIAANRDEAVDRPSRPPEIYSEEPRVIAPRDATAGGTWIGYNEFGVCVALTNFWTDADLAGDRSRGLLVADVLQAESASEGVAIVEDAIQHEEYDGFQLVVADSTDACCFRWDGTLLRTEFEPGVHVVVNVAIDDDASIPAFRRDTARQQAENAQQVRRSLAVKTGEAVADWLYRAGAVLSDHDYGVCIHGDGFGTRSSSLLSIGHETRYLYAPGPPCETAYERVTVADRDGGCVDTERHI